MPQYKRNADGYFKKSIVVGRLPNGNQKREVVRSKNLAEFKEMVQRAENLRKFGYDFDAKNMTVQEWAVKWFETYKKPHVSLTTAASYEGDLQAHIIPHFGHMRLEDIKPYKLQEFLNSYSGQSTSHVSKIRLTIRQLFKRAYIEGMITKDISEGLIMPETITGERRPLTDAERAAVIYVAETHRVGLWILVMLYAGLRPEETVSLMWADICLEPGKESITVKRAASWAHNQPVLKKPKKKERKQGKDAERTIPIPPTLSEKLRKAPHRGLYVFPRAESDKMVSRTYMKRMWAAFYRAVDIYMGAEVYRNKIVKHAFDPNVTPYYMRHSCCTNWFELGLDLKTVQYLMGHADIKTTANIYTHFMGKSVDHAGAIIRGDFGNRGQNGDNISRTV